MRRALILGFMLTAGYAAAHTGATGPVKERMDAMSAIADALKAIAPMATGKSEADPAVIEAHAATIIDHAGQIPDLFSEETPGGISEARAVIWRDWEDFTARAARMQAAAEGLRDMASTDDPQALEASFGELAQTCKGCHELYREKK